MMKRRTFGDTAMLTLLQQECYFVHERVPHFDFLLTSPSMIAKAYFSFRLSSRDLGEGCRERGVSTREPKIVDEAGSSPGANWRR